MLQSDNIIQQKYGLNGGDAMILKWYIIIVWCSLQSNDTVQWLQEYDVLKMKKHSNSMMFSAKMTWSDNVIM